MKNKLYFDKDFNTQLEKIIQAHQESHFFIIVDENTHTYCWPLISDLFIAQKEIDIIEIPAGESSKSIEIVGGIWQTLIEMNAKRNDIIINLGGGVVSDLGGFIAASFKRGMKYYNIPTSLLSMIDASVGGKTAINFDGYKNNIGFFYPPTSVFIHSFFLKTLPLEHLKSGFGEMMKHALIDGGKLWDEMQLIQIDHLEEEIMNNPHLIESAVNIKKEIVLKDPKEENIRKILNLGHTIGHALESYYLQQKEEIFHGQAIASGLILEGFLAYRYLGFSKESLTKLSETLFSFCHDKKIAKEIVPRLIELMVQDKKNTGSGINFSLLSEIGNPKYDQNISESKLEKDLAEAIQYFNLFGK